MTKLLGRLGMAQKLSLLVLALLLPLLFLTFTYVSGLQKALDADQAGVDGLDYFEGLEHAIVPVTRHSSLAGGLVLDADPGLEKRLAEAAAAADEAFDKFAKADERLGRDGDQIRSLGREVLADWKSLKDGWRQLGVAEVRARHAALVAKSQRVLTLIGNAYSLDRGLDPAVFGAKALASTHAPSIQLAYGPVREIAVELAVTRRPATVRDREVIAVGLANLTARAARAKQAVELAAEHPTHGAQFAAIGSGPLAQVIDESAGVFKWYDQSVVPGQPVSFTVDEVWARGAAMHKGFDALSSGATEALHEVLVARAKSSATQRNVGTVVIGVALVFALWLAIWLTRSVTGGLREALGVFGQIQKGNFDNAIAVKSKDEVGQVLQGLDEMQAKLKEQIERDRRIAAENERVRTALDKVTTNVMLADADGQIIYMNEAVTAMFRHNAAEIRKQLPGFDADKILGSSFDQFHRSPAHQRNMLGALTGTHESQMKLGNATLKIVANPVVDRSGVRLGTAVQWFDRTQEVATEEEIQLVVQAALDGDLMRRIRKDGKTGFFAILADGMNRLLENMADVVRTIKRAAHEVGSGADEISKGNANLSQRTEEQASSLEETASSMEEMTSTVKQNADNAQQANQLALAARGQAEKGGSVVSAAVAAMSEINASSKKIADIIGVIDEIAFQTNLLALNAAVEAARAGEQGRGFAVVASEVRNLASRSAEAAKEIKALIQDSVGKVGEGAKLVDQSGQTLAEIVGAVKKVADIIAEISAASQEQSSGIEQVNKAVMSMDEVTQQNAALVEEAAAAAEALMEQARALNETMAKYRTGEDERGPAYGGAERRTANRPWSQVKAAAAAGHDDHPAAA